MRRFRAVLSVALLSLALPALVAAAPAQAPASPGSSTASSAAAATTPLIPRSVLFGNPERTSPEISPDGQWVAYTVATAQFGEGQVEYRCLDDELGWNAVAPAHQAGSVRP